MRKAKYSVGQRLRTVRGPGGALNPEPRFLGHVGTVVKVQEFKTCQPVYVLDFESLGEDTVEEVCLEECDYSPARRRLQPACNLARWAALPCDSRQSSYAHL